MSAIAVRYFFVSNSVEKLDKRFAKSPSKKRALAIGFPTTDDPVSLGALCVFSLYIEICMLAHIFLGLCLCSPATVCPIK